MASAKFSASSLLADLSPSVNSSHCIKPQVVQSPPPGSVLAPIVPTTPGAQNSSSTPGAKIASVTLSDCLTCSGCVTTAEDLLAGADSAALLEEALLAQSSEKGGKKVVVVLSQQSVASVAVRLGISLDECARLLCGALKGRGVNKVYDGAVGNIIALRETAAEVGKKRKRGTLKGQETIEGPILGSMCPAVAIYVEKTQGESIVELLSKVKSVQGIMGKVLGSEVFAVAAMPCHDRKLEAARLKGEGIDLVMTTEELVRFVGEDILRERRTTSMEIDPIAGILEPRPFGANVASGSGGYAEFVLRQLTGMDVNEVVEWKDIGRGGLIKEAEKDGIKVARAYGFKAISRVLRKIKSKKCSYAYVEAMSCPGGCNNGGGQLKGEGREANNRILERTESIFSHGYADPTQNTDESGVVYNGLVGDDVGSTTAQKLFHTTFKKRTAKDAEQVDLNW